MKPGVKVHELTKKVGQAGRVGTVKAVRGDSVEVTWENGRSSIVSRIALVEEEKAKK